MAMPEVASLRVRVRRREVLRALGYPRAKPPSATVAERIEGLMDEATSLLHARGAFRLIDNAEAVRIGVPSPTAEVAAAVCTVGAALEQRSQQLADSGDPLGALILDAFGSVAAEDAAEALQARACLALQERGLSATRRISPGYGAWPLARQSELLALLPAASLAITLSEGGMMSPRKSVSFAAMIGAPQHDGPHARCAACDLLDCRYRRPSGVPQEDEEP
jgi:hypothetical protein